MLNVSNAYLLFYTRQEVALDLPILPNEVGTPLDKTKTKRGMNAHEAKKSVYEKASRGRKMSDAALDLVMKEEMMEVFKKKELPKPNGDKEKVDERKVVSEQQKDSDSDSSSSSAPSSDSDSDSDSDSEGVEKKQQAAAVTASGPVAPPPASSSSSHTSDKMADSDSDSESDADSESSSSVPSSSSDDSESDSDLDLDEDKGSSSAPPHPKQPSALSQPLPPPLPAPKARKKPAGNMQLLGNVAVRGWSDSSSDSDGEEEGGEERQRGGAMSEGVKEARAKAFELIEKQKLARKR